MLAIETFKTYFERRVEQFFAESMRGYDDARDGKLEPKNVTQAYLRGREIWYRQNPESRPKEG